MSTIVRLILLVVVVPSAYYFIYWVPSSLIPVGDQHWIRNLVSLIIALVIGWFTWNSTKKNSCPSLASSIFTGAFIFGGIGFFGGFFGPLIFMPGANQGPLLGILFTGPLGFLAGGLAGLIYWIVGSKKNNEAKDVI